MDEAVAHGEKGTATRDVDRVRGGKAHHAQLGGVQDYCDPARQRDVCASCFILIPPAIDARLILVAVDY